ncbi:hypothetical protein [Halorubrum vacuolatum]|uniref:hypothetical protein n=1 Tax=Halorubrum vacuolatum TaxID=63740 RepID=UPI001179D7CC|nr:hypothetical protein [Halorubrum vacuolatum]
MPESPYAAGAVSAQGMVTSSPGSTSPESHAAYGPTGLARPPRPHASVGQRATCRAETFVACQAETFVACQAETYVACRSTGGRRPR